MQKAKKGDRIGMALDLDKGSMTVYKNGERLGVMQESGLTGEYVWAAQFDGGAVRIAGRQDEGDFDPAFTEACLKWKVKSLRERDAIPADEGSKLASWLFSPEAARLGLDASANLFASGAVHCSLPIYTDGEPNAQGVLPLHRAARHGRLDIVRFLLRQVHPRNRGAFLDAQTLFEHTALHWACVYRTARQRWLRS
eukprot:COSAG04_NODE_91_length_26852_cov_8.609315_12_plen_196_part_00